jgi:transglutaminase-like putative cysteine protease
MKYRVVHQTSYRYSESASLSQNELILEPRTTATQEIRKSQLVIDPEPQYLHRHIDYFGNVVHVFMVQQPHNELTITETSYVTTWATAAPSPGHTPSWDITVRRLADHCEPMELDAYQFVFESPLIAIFPEIEAYARHSFLPGTPVLQGAMDLMERIHKEFVYDKAATSVDTAVDQVFEKKKGVCQDFAHLTISCLRSLGLAARYVSGYLETLPPPGKPKMIGADASHAWISLFVPDVGWIDLDPTNDLLPEEKHITLAWGRDYGDVTPVKGVVMGGGQHRLSVMVDVMGQETSSIW